MAFKLGGAPKCFNCDKSVYFNDQKSFQSNVWHQSCFKCSNCNKKLESGTANVAPTGDKLVCNECNRTLARQSSTSNAASNSATCNVNHNDIECCPRCGKRVYFAEQILAQGRKYHKACFSCSACNKKVDSTSATDHEGQLFCKGCHGKKFGPKGYGFASGAGTMLSMDVGSTSVNSTPVNTAPATRPLNGSCDPKNPECCPRCGKRVYFAEQILALSRKWHKSCFNCSSCGKKVDSTSATDHDGDLFCRPCHGKQFGPKGYGYAGGAGTMLSMDGDSQTKSRSSSVTSDTGPTNHNDIECCPRCGKRVYFAEQILALGRKYHKSCFSCSACNKKVDSTSATDHEGQLFCKSCHGKKFGPKGYGYASGAGTMLSMDDGETMTITKSDLPYTQAQQLEFQ